MTKPMQLSIEDENILNSPEYKSWRAEHIEDAVNEYLKRAKDIVKPSVTWLQSVVESTNLAYYKEYILPHLPKTPENPPEKRREKSIMFHTASEQVYGIDNADFSELPKKGEDFRVHGEDYEVVGIKTAIYDYPELRLEQVMKHVELRKKLMSTFTYEGEGGKILKKEQVKIQEVSRKLPRIRDAIKVNEEKYFVLAVLRGEDGHTLRNGSFIPISHTIKLGSPWKRGK